jgi:RNA-binding protein YhbY
VSGLTSRQRSALRALAHGLEPRDRVERAAAADAIAAGVGAEVAGRIGRIAILYRRQRDPARRRIELPPA